MRLKFPGDEGGGFRGCLLLGMRCRGLCGLSKLGFVQIIDLMLQNADILLQLINHSLQRPKLFNRPNRQDKKDSEQVDYAQN